MTDFPLPVEIQAIIVQHAELEDIFSLALTCRRLYEGVFASDEAFKIPVLTRIPWLKIREPGSRLTCWREAARMIVTRAKSMKNEPQKWCFAHTNYEANLTGMLKNISVEYVEPVDITGKPLPASYDPLTDETVAFHNYIGGKFMEVAKPAGHKLDLTTLKFHKGKCKSPYEADRPLYDVSRASKTTQCPHSKLKVRSLRGDAIHVIQENDKWIHLAVCQHAKIAQEYMLDKETAPRDKGVLTLDTFDMSCHYIGGGPERNVIVHMLPGKLGSFLFMLPGDMCVVNYFDGDDAFPLLKLSNYYEQIRDLKYLHPPHLKVYAGMIYLFYCDAVMIPLWADRGRVTDPVAQKNPIGAMTPSMKSIRVTYDFERRFPPELNSSTDNRYLMDHNRVVADFAKAKTYIVKDSGAFGYNSLIFTGKSGKDVPIFYKWSTVYAIFFNKYVWRLVKEPEKQLKMFLEKSKQAEKLENLVFKECAPGFNFDQKEKSGTMTVKTVKF